MSNIQVKNINGLGYSPYSHRNKLINGGFDVWQRGGGPFVGAVYGPDRWKGTSTDITLTQVSVGNKKRLNITCNGTYKRIEQRIELPSTEVGKTYTASMKIKYNTLPSNSDRQLIVRWNGSSLIAIAVPTNLVTTEQEVSVSFVIPEDDITGTYDYLRFELGTTESITEAFDMDIWEVQLEEGSVATPFEQRPIGTELALCQRYYERIEFTGTNLTSAPFGAQQFAHYFFKVKKRISPVATSSGWLNTTPTSTDAAKELVTFQHANTAFYASAGTIISADAEL